MHSKLIGDVASVPNISDYWTRICSALKQNGFPIRLNVYALELLQADLQILETVQSYISSMPTISREENDAVIVAILGLRPCLANL